MDQRASPRNQTNVTLSCRVPARPCQAELRDVSREGCRLQLNDAHAELGATALLDLPCAPQWPGRVVWVSGNTAGIRFNRRLRTATAVALGLEEGVAKADVNEPYIEPPSPRIEQLLRHWIRRLTARLS